MITEVILYFIILATAWPVGVILAKICSDELMPDRRYFILMTFVMGLSFISLLIFFRKVSILLSLIYMIILLGVMILNVSGKS